jgi:hypothetical protein
MINMIILFAYLVYKCFFFQSDGSILVILLRFTHVLLTFYDVLLYYMTLRLEPIIWHDLASFSSVRQDVASRRQKVRHICSPVHWQGQPRQKKLNMILVFRLLIIIFLHADEWAGRS